MELTINEIVTRKKLAEVVGAGGDSCFLHKDCIVVAIAMDPNKNPDAPNILLVGQGPQKERYAELFRQSGGFVPTFVKEAVDQWRYVGRYRALTIENDPAVIKSHSQKSGRNNIWGVLSLGPEIVK
jgi:hypothetical protein